MNFQDRVAQKQQERSSPGTTDLHNEAEINVEQFEHSHYFGIDQLRNHPSCIDLRLADGTFKALPYTYILEINYAPSEGIEIITTSKRVSIKGRNLKLLYHYLTAYRVKFIQANIGNDLEEEKLLFVRELKIEEI
ncbi:hypothetical protein BH10BAC2_BH10BAC2_27080 [soil metagenome]